MPGVLSSRAEVRGLREAAARAAAVLVGEAQAEMQRLADPTDARPRLRCFGGARRTLFEYGSGTPERTERDSQQGTK